jgi:hypothetical protein
MIAQDPMVRRLVVEVNVDNASNWSYKQEGVRIDSRAAMSWQRECDNVQGCSMRRGPTERGGEPNLAADMLFDGGVAMLIAAGRGDEREAGFLAVSTWPSRATSSANFLTENLEI